MKKTEEMQYEDYEAFGDMLILYRKHNKMKSSEFAKRHGISRATLWRIEHAKSTDIPISLHNEILTHALAEREQKRIAELKEIQTVVTDPDVNGRRAVVEYIDKLLSKENL